MTAVLHIEGVDELARDLDTLAKGQWLVRLRISVGELLRAAIAQYPSSPRYPLRWASEKQRFWFKRAAREGRIEVPYRRQFALNSERLGGWATRTEGDQAFVGTRVSYAPYVQSAEQQQPFHADTGWKTDKQAVEEVARSGDIERAARELLDELLR